MKKSLLFIVISSLLLLSGCNNNSDNDNDDGINTISETPSPDPANSNEPSENRLQNGTWGAEKLTMYVKETQVDMKFACAEGRIEGVLEPDTNGHYRKAGTISSFSNRTGRIETVTATYVGIVSSDRSVIALSVSYNDPDDNTTQDVREEYVLRRDVVSPQHMCTFGPEN